MTPSQQRTDGELLTAFAADGSQAAFTELVHRHGAMVHGLCWRVLGDPHEAEDVTQAVFLTLARKAATLRKDPSVAGWLHHVAVCLARNARLSRRGRQQRVEEAMQTLPTSEESAVDRLAFRAELDAAIDQLPERYRRPLVLFHLEGQTLQQTAAQLGLNPATTGTRLSRARELLRKKLVRRGVTVGSVGALTVLLSAESGAAVLPPTFVASTVGAATGGAVSTTVAALTKGALDMLFWNSVKTVAAVTVASTAIVGTGVVVAQKPGPGQSYIFVDDNNRVAVAAHISARVDNLLFYVDANDPKKLVCREYGEQGKTLWTISLPAAIEKLETGSPCNASIAYGLWFRSTICRNVNGAVCTACSTRR